MSLQDSDYVNALRLAKFILEKEFVNIDVQAAAAEAAVKLGDTAAARYHWSTMDELVQSILSSGDGKSIETAYVVISVGEEYAVLRFLKCSLKMQELAEYGAKSYDVMTVSDSTGAETILYFDISLLQEDIEPLPYEEE
jgi:hypothetical protein